MPMRAMLPIAVGVWLALGPRADAALRQCIMFPDTEELFRNNDVVFAGTVLSSTRVAGPDDGVQNVGLLRAEQFWKGTPRKEMRVGSDVPFLVGERYVVFASGDPLSTTIECEATQLLARAMKKRLWLSRLPSRKAG